MRISDWSSDVCSSDLRRPPCGEYRRPPSSMDRSCGNAPVSVVVTQDSHADGCWESEHCRTAKGEVPRSEEHTSELQSLMRISYAVFCLKKKNNTKQPTEQY